MTKILKVEVDVSMYSSINLLKDSNTKYEIARMVDVVLKSQNKKAPSNSVIKASKNAISLLLSKRKKLCQMY